MSFLLTTNSVNIQKGHSSVMITLPFVTSGQIKTHIILPRYKTLLTLQSL